MNERIRRLAMQAKLGPALLIHHWGTVNALTDSEQAGLQQLEKFAQLIVRECIDIAQDRANFPGFPPNDVNDIIDEFKEHFGVEE